MTENLLPEKFGNVFVTGRTVHGKTRIQADVMRAVLKGLPQNPAASSDDSDAPSSPDGETRDEQ